MNGLRNDLQRARNLAPTPRLALQVVTRRAERRARIRRLGTATLALTIGAAAILGAFAALREPTANRAAEGGETPTSAAAAIPALGPGRFAYTEATSYWGTFGTNVDDPNGASRLLEYTMVPVRVWLEADGSSTVITPHDERLYPPGGTDLGDVSSLSADPTILREQLIARGDPAGASPQPAVSPAPGQAPMTGGVWRAISDLVESGLLSPSVRAALVEVAAGLETAETDAHDTDPVGRSAELITIVTEGIRHELWVDSGTRQPLALRDTWLGTGQVVSLWIVERSGIGDSVHKAEPLDALVPAPVTDLPTASGLFADQPGPKGSAPQA